MPEKWDPYTVPFSVDVFILHRKCVKVDLKFFLICTYGGVYLVNVMEVQTSRSISEMGILQALRRCVVAV